MSLLDSRQRLRVTFVKGEEIKYISHLDLLRLWERVLRRARVPLAYSHGFNPRPRLFLAAPLPVGFTGQAELMDVLLTRRTVPLHFVRRVASQLPPGLQIVSVEEVYPALPPLASQVRFSEYRVVLVSQVAWEELQARVEELLCTQSLPMQRQRKGRRQDYDLRPLVHDLWVEKGEEDQWVLGMRLRTDEHGTGRPEAVVEALRLPVRVVSIQRQKLILKGGRGEQVQAGVHFSLIS